MRAILITLGIFVYSLGNIASKPTNSVDQKRKEEDIKAIIDCLRQSLDGGNEEAGIPDHRSIQSKEVFTFPLGLVDGTNISLTMKDIQYNNIPDFDVKSVKIIGETQKSDQLLSNFSIIHRGITIDAKYFALLNETNRVNATAHIDIGPLEILGSFDFNPKLLYVNKLQIKLIENYVPKCTFEKFDERFAAKVGTKIGLAIKYSLGELEGNTPIQEAIKEDINRNYLAKDKRYRLNAILHKCKSQYYLE